MSINEYRTDMWGVKPVAAAIAVRSKSLRRRWKRKWRDTRGCIKVSKIMVAGCINNSNAPLKKSTPSRLQYRLWSPQHLAKCPSSGLIDNYDVYSGYWICWCFRDTHRNWILAKKSGLQKVVHLNNSGICRLISSGCWGCNRELEVINHRYLGDEPRLYGDIDF